MRQIISPLDGFRSPFGALRGGFSPTRLFALAEPGVWYDPSDVANLNWRRNLLTFTEQFDNAVWSKSNATISANNGAAPDSATTADLFYPTATGTSLIFTGSAARPQAISCYAKASGKQWIAIGTNTNTADVAFFNLQTGTVGAVGANMTSAAIQDVGSGWYRVSVVATTAAAGAVGCAFFVTDANSSLSVTASGTSGILIWGAQLELGSVATDYQRISDVNTEVIERFPSATLYQDTAGTQPVTTPGQTVALALDKSKGLMLGPELVTAGWSLDAGWSQSGQTFTAIGTVANADAEVSGIVVANRTYQVQVTWGGLSAASAWRFYLLQFTGAFDISQTTDGTSGSRTYRVTAPSSGTLTGIRALTNSSSGTFTISVRELPGFHATQATAASRPTYGIVPATGRRNLLTFTEQFDNAAWAKTNATVTANAGTAPDGTTTADKVVPNTVNTQHHVSVSFTSVASQYTMTVYAKADGYQWLWFNATGAGSPVNDLCWFDVLNGVVGTAQTGATTSIEGVGGGWYRCICSWSAFTANSAGVWIAVASADNQSAGFTGDGTSGILIWGAQLETGSTATAYQRVGAPSAVSGLSFDVTEAGVQSLSYLWFDGVDDFLVTPTITPGIDKAQVFAGVRKLSDATAGIIVESSASIELNNGTIILFTNPNTYGAKLRGSLNPSAITAPTSYAPPITNVVTALGDIAADLNTLRINATQQATASSDLGTGNLLAYPLYIGRRGGTTLPFNGQIYSLLVRFGANLDAGTTTSTETWVGGKTGIDIAKWISPTIFARDETAILDRFNATIERRAV